jgi:hypothetical protein
MVVVGVLAYCGPQFRAISADEVGYGGCMIGLLVEVVTIKCL